MSRVLRSALPALLLLALPGVLPAQCDHFRRGDANGDGDVDLSDAVGTLLFLFVGGPEPECRDAADADDSGELKLTDAIYTLGFLFLGNPPPPAPGPFECGRDETSDDLDCFSQEACDPAPATRDLSGFGRFEYHQDPALGFCPEEDRVFTAFLEKLDGGRYHLEMTVLEPGIEGVDDCLPHIRGSPCLVSVALPPRDLTPEEVDRAREAFQALLVHEEHDLICECIAIDPCRIAQFRWDALATSDFLCSPPYLDRTSAGEVLGLLESLRAGG